MYIYLQFKKIIKLLYIFIDSPYFGMSEYSIIERANPLPVLPFRISSK